MDVDASGELACVTYTDGALECFGDDLNDYHDPGPRRRDFVQVRLRDGTACAVRRDRTIRCWGGLILEDALEALPQAPRWTEMLVSERLGLALRDPEGRWHWQGRSMSFVSTHDELRDLQSQHPPEDILELSFTTRSACALLEDGTIACSDGPLNDEGGAPYRALVHSSKTDDICHVDRQRTFRCENSPPSLTIEGVLPGSPMAASWSHLCVARAHETTCVGPSSSLTQAPPGPLRDLDLEDASACGVTTRGELVCWGELSGALSSPPEGDDFVEVAMTRRYACARRATGALACWGDRPEGLLEQLAGDWRQVSAGDELLCALDARGHHRCWGGHVHAR